MAQNTNSSIQAKAVITTASTMEVVQQTIVHHLTEVPNALAAFDVDMTLTVPQHPACHHPNIKKHYALLKKFLAPLNELERHKTFTLAVQAPGQQLAEANTPVVIKKLQQRGITTIAFTASLTGVLEGLGNLPRNRFQELKALENSNFRLDARHVT